MAHASAVSQHPTSSPFARASAYAWEPAFLRKVEESRESELKIYRSLAYAFGVGMNGVFLALPNALPLIAFAVMVWAGDSLTPARVFTTLQLFDVRQPRHRAA